MSYYIIYNVSSYIKLIIFILALLIISAAVVLIDSSVDNINKTMPEISDSIVNGDKEYNEAVTLVNEKSFYEGMGKVESAGKNYNDSLEKIQSIKNRFSKDLNEVQNKYFDTIIKELDLKIQAVDKFKEAIDCFEVNSNYTGSNYAFEANDLMYNATQYQHERDEMVRDNPKLFK